MRLPSSLFRPGVWWVAVSVWFVTLFILSSQSKIPSTQFTFGDKIVHFAYFAAGSTAFFLALRLNSPPVSLLFAVVLTIAFAALVGWFDEWHQSHTPGRSGNDLFDWIADLAGGVFACFLGAFLFQQIKKRAKT